MQESDIPASWLLRWAQNAGGSYVHAIPVPSQIGITDGAASLNDGFVPLNFLPDAAGGVPPFGDDMNGILAMLSGWAQWVQAGVLAKYDATFSTAIGGYPKGALLNSTILDGTLWVSTADDNTNDPDVTPTGWLNITQGRLIGRTVYVTAGSYTYAAPAGARRTRIRAAGGAGAGGGTQATSGTQVAVGGGGGAGANGEIWVEDDCDGVTVTVGAAGVAAAGMAGGAGGDTSVGTLLACPAGQGGALGVAAVPAFFNGGGTGGAAASSAGADTTAIFLSGGMAGGGGFAFTISNAASGFGGSCAPYGSGGAPVADAAGVPGIGSGAGGSGACALPSEAQKAGGGGTAGIVIMEAYS